MIAAILSVWALLAGIALLMAGSGLQGSLLGLRASDEGFSVLVTGLVMSSYFGGFVLGGLAAPRLIRRVGHIRVFGALASLASITALLHALFVDPFSWAALRALTGFLLHRPLHRRRKLAQRPLHQRDAGPDPLHLP